MFVSLFSSSKEAGRLIELFVLDAWGLCLVTYCPCIWHVQRLIVCEQQYFQKLQT